MADPWLTIIGVGEDGLAGLAMASRDALQAAEMVFGAPRHLELLGVDGTPWDVPFTLVPVVAARGRRVVVLASGDPFWYGVGGSLAAVFAPEEWVCHPAASTFGLAASRLGWRLEEVVCLGLHAAPLERLRPVLAQGVRVICLLRDGAALGDLARYLVEVGFGASRITAFSCLGGPRESTGSFVAQDYDGAVFPAPVCVGITAAGRGMSRGSGLEDGLFDHDGQITKRPVRALTLSALAPRPGQVLWDIGTGSGSVSIEFLLAAPATFAHAVEADAMRADRARGNAARFGVGHRYFVTCGRAPDVLHGMPMPDVVFVGGGASEALFAALWDRLPAGVRLVANAVTLESEALLALWHGRKGGSLLRIELAEAAPLGSRTGWQPMRPVVQWSVVL
ncbi:MAG: precorrin-6y C5,15-methyltransferase (decarboxylating) subunit CbiE [Candidatus Saccharibacteria bacterium]|nr:precorrin-6y C5,15-methyltransferase (decarboxylating) subunit CbiE [Pseudorhodobacter sp.]